MLYPVLTLVFLASVALIAGVLLWAAISPRSLWERRRGASLGLLAWFVPYALFCAALTGPTDLARYPPAAESPYRLPWAAGVERCVAQGNRGITSHRGLHHFAWDFIMANGTPILAARSGVVAEVVDHHQGIGFAANLISVEHRDGTRAGYAHIQKNSAMFRVGDQVRRGQPIARSGMVGQTVFPHLHFYVRNREGTASIPISFNEVPAGVPLFGRCYRSNNKIATAQIVDGDGGLCGPLCPKGVGFEDVANGDVVVGALSIE